MVPEPQNRFTRREGIERGSVRAAFFVFLGAVGVIGWSYVFLMSDAYMLKDIEVRGLKSLDPLDVKRQAYEIIDARARPFWQPARHRWFFHKEDLEQALTEKLFAEHVTVDTIDNNILRLSIQERSRKFILRTPRQSWWVDLQGTVLQELTLSEERVAADRRSGKRASTQDDPPMIYLEISDALEVGKGILDPRISTWLNIARQVQKQGIGYREIQPTENASSTRVTLKTSKGYNVWLDTADTLETQLEAYSAFERQKPKDTVVQEYVDVRIPSRIYVK